MKKKFRIPGTDVYILLIQDSDGDVAPRWENDVTYLSPETRTEDIAKVHALGFPWPLVDDTVVDGGDLEAVSE